MLKHVPHRAKHAEDHPTRQRLIDAAAEQVREIGSDDIDVDKVLKEVGVTKGSLYHHFESMNDLIIAAHLQVFAEGMREGTQAFSLIRQECTSAEEVRERLGAIVRRSQDPDRRWLRAQRAGLLALASSNEAVRIRVASLQSEITDEVTEVMEDFRSKGWLRDDVDPRAVAVFMQAFTLGRILDDIVDDASKVDPGLWMEAIEKWAETFFVPNEKKTRS